MKLSYLWLKDYIEACPLPPDLSNILTNLGLEVEDLTNYTTIPGNLESLVVGYTLSVVPHPNADRLRICSVDTGSDIPLSIVCGAPNVALGQKVIVAPVGAMVHPTSGEPFMINKSKIRGEYSEGMLCADDEVGLGTSHEGIRILPDHFVVGKPLRDYFPSYEDFIFEIGITPNRSDALSHRGAARDILAFLRNGQKLKPILPASYSLKPKVGELSNSDQKEPNSTIQPIQIQIDSPENCYRFCGITIQGVVVKESPEWLKNRLAAIGIRPINNIVDITNFICHDLGQPLHAYDADKISKGKIIAKNAKSGESLVTLDGQTRNINQEDLLIYDGEKALGIAGVFGGMGSGIQTNTKNIFLESAAFNPVCVRKTSRKLNLKTDASFRFERGVDPETTFDALHSAVNLVLELAGGNLISDFMDIYPNTIHRPKIVLRKSRLYSLIGQWIDPKEVVAILEGLEIKILNADENSWHLEIPLFKADVTREADIIEEVLRVYGFNRVEIPDQIRSSINPSNKPDPEKIQESVCNFLSARGFHEIQSNSLINSGLASLFPPDNFKEPVTVLHPLSQDTNMLRTSMIPSMLRAMEYNFNRKSLDVKFYELGKVYSVKNKVYEEFPVLAFGWSGNSESEAWNMKIEPVSIFTVKGLIRSLMEKMNLGFEMIKTENPGILNNALEIIVQNERVGWIGQIRPQILKTFHIDREVYYAELYWDKILEKFQPKEFVAKEIPKFPRVQRDLSLILPEQINFDELSRLVKKAKIQLLDEMTIFDVYQGARIPEGKKSYSLRFYLQDSSRTLNEEEIDGVMKKLLELFMKEVHAEIPL